MTARVAHPVSQRPAGRDWATAAVLHGGVLLGLLVLSGLSPVAPRLQRLTLPMQWAEAPAPVLASPQPAPVVPPLPPIKPQRVEAPKPVAQPQRVALAAAVAAPAVEPLAATAAPYAAPAAAAVERAESPATLPPAAPAAVSTAKAPAVAPAGPAHDPGAEHRWQAQLEAHLARDKHYPLQARRARQEGVVLVEAHFNAEGALVQCVVATSSGFTLLDDAALAMVRRAAEAVRLHQQPGRNARLRLPIEFELKES